MHHYYSLEDIHLQDAWLTIGSFDGVHRGHQEIVRRMTAGAHRSGSPAVVLTFFPHPAMVLGRRQDPFYLTSPEERAALLGDLGVDIVITHPFNREVANTSAVDFMTQLHSHLNLSHLWVGYDFALGRNRQGDVKALRQMGMQLGYALHVLEPVLFEGQVISSSQIRSALANGDVESAALMLGRPFRITGEVVKGDGRGRPLGIPTANLSIWSDQVIPKAGVFACRVGLDEATWNAVTNVGVRPTFETQPVPARVETHILDFDQDLYGRQLQLDFIARLRDEQRFSSVQALVEQIHEDITLSREILSRETITENRTVNPAD